MKCPFCRADHDRVIDSRSFDEGNAIRRRRECLKCKRRYTTYERPEDPAIKIVKKDGIREPFQREKIRRGLEKACWKRPVTSSQIEELVASVAAEVDANFDVEVDSRIVGELVIERLKELDQIAFVRFASVYRDFRDVQHFVEELQPMLMRPKHPADDDE